MLRAGWGGYLINLKNKLSVVSQACEPPEKSHAPGYKIGYCHLHCSGDDPGFASGSYKLNTANQACDTRDKDTRGKRLMVGTIHEQGQSGHH